MTAVKIKKAKDSKSCVLKGKIKFENDKICLEATQLVNKLNIQKKKLIQIVFKNNKGFIKSNKLILKSQQRFKTETHNVFAEEINKIALSSNDDTRIHSIDLAKSYAYGTSKVLVSEKEEIRCNNLIKRF